MNQHLRVMAPVWPLQNIVAVNPFWNQIDLPFDEVMDKMSHLLHTPLYMPTSYFLEKYQKGEIKDQDIQSVVKLSENSYQSEGSAGSARFFKNSSSIIFDLEQFLGASYETTNVVQRITSFTDFIDQNFKLNWRSFVTYEIAKYASAYFDEGQALVKFPWSDLSFYRAWFAAQEFDKSFQKFGAVRFQEIISEFKLLNAETAIQTILSRLGLSGENEIAFYIERLTVINHGWASQFSYHEWRGQLGYSSNENVRSIELIAVQMIVDYAIAEHFESSHSGITKSWLESFRSTVSKQRVLSDQFKLNRIWQSALERSRQRVEASLIKPCKAQADLPRVQIAMCLDVRSETYRRAIESIADNIETIGFAGFFGLPFEYQKIDEKKSTQRLPVLLKAGFTLKEEVISGRASFLRVKTLARSYFRNLRKAPMSSFLFVELFSLLACRKLVQSFFASISVSTQSSIPKRFSDRQTQPSQNSVTSAEGLQMTLQTKIDVAAKILTHMGLETRFGKLIVFAGHGSHNSNNAFNSASDCGACGGHSGDVNSRFLAALLNNSEVRLGLKKYAIEIPESTRFVGAIHETVTDELYLLDQKNIPDSHQEDLNFISSAIKKAGTLAKSERQFARSNCLDSSAWRRAKNWSEVRPEWALAGNSSFIVAPRRFTKNSNFDGRAFLHDYDWHEDKNFETLELIMTAPMLVTNWINFQYYASTVAPSVYSSGNKVIHNLVNETGVLEGNGGDLRIGLPWQSIHDGIKFVHDPVRLAVYIAAPTEEIERLISKHQSVRNLVVNQWLFIFHIDDMSGEIKRRENNGEYKLLSSLS